MHQSVPNVPKFPSEITNRDESQKLNWIEGLEDTLVECYEDWSLPSNLGVKWSQKGKSIWIND